MTIVTCCLLRLNQSSFLQKCSCFKQKVLLPSDIIQAGLVLPSFEQDHAYGPQEEYAGNLDEQNEEVHVDELGRCKIAEPLIIVLANEASNDAHVGEVRGDPMIRPQLVGGRSNDADQKRYTLGIEAVLQEPSYAFPVL